MQNNKKIYTQYELDERVRAVLDEYESLLMQGRDRIEELKSELAAAEQKISAYESEREVIHKAITVALQKADDMERVSLIRYNQEIAQLKSFHDKWTGYYNRIIEKYPLDNELITASKINDRITEVLGKTGDIEAQYDSEKARLERSVEKETAATTVVADNNATVTDDYKDRSPAGFSIWEALHPKEDLKDIMKELGIIIDE